MTQTLPLTMILGAAHTGKAIGYRVLNLDRTVYSAFTTTGVGESATIPGTYYVSGGISAPDAGGHIIVGTVAEDLREQTIENASAAGTGLTAQETANAVHNLAPVGAAAAGSLGAKVDAKAEPGDPMTIARRP